MTERCVHLCRAGQHILVIHTKNDQEECSRIESRIWNWALSCEPCYESGKEVSGTVEGLVK